MINAELIGMKLTALDLKSNSVQDALQKTEKHKVFKINKSRNRRGKLNSKEKILDKKPIFLNRIFKKSMLTCIRSNKVLGLKHFHFWLYLTLLNFVNRDKKVRRILTLV